MTGFTQDSVAFLRDLADNNHRDWFAAHKQRYEQALKIPGKAFCDRMCERLTAYQEQTVISKIYRLHRDLRFSKDKTPYNAHFRASFFPETRGLLPQAWHVSLEPHGF